MKGVTVCLDDVSFVLCPPFIIKEKEMSVETLIKISNSSKEQLILLLIFPVWSISETALLRMSSLWKPYKGLYANKIYLYFLTSFMTLLFSLVENYFVILFIFIFWPECLSTNVSTVLIKFPLSIFFRWFFFEKMGGEEGGWTPWLKFQLVKP